MCVFVCSIVVGFCSSHYLAFLVVADVVAVFVVVFA